MLIIYLDPNIYTSEKSSFQFYNSVWKSGLLSMQSAHIQNKATRHGSKVVNWFSAPPPPNGAVSILPSLQQKPTTGF